MNEIHTSTTALSGRLTGAAWRKSTRSQTSNCVEVAPLDSGPATVALRDSKDPSGPVLLFDRAGWLGFLAGTKSGQFDLD
ncbi:MULTISPECIES: DUF397 domain-containing protein [Micromonospora]|uniref:DUF397 domain-containing protein n=1 Tax=Micromonospora TaxID=1873 RepID=UPI00207D2BA1|nr:DUF397 domain-containing protein [Micromonospora sp. CPM1]MCO1617572.1 DUF397 domain-containing protein [Micromonospora sp. CPM1]